MRKIIGAVFQSLDGVMQAPGGPDEDPTGGFAHGGWMFPLADEGVGAEIGQLFSRDFDLLLGRRTYQIFAAYWPYAPDETKDIRDPFNACTKYVVTAGDAPLAWEKSVRVSGMDALRAIKQEDGRDLIIQGSSTLYPQLLEAGLLDRVTVMTFPVLLGGGKRLFGDGTPSKTMRLADHRVSERGTIIATYEPAGSVDTGSFASDHPSEREQVRQAAMQEGTW